MVGEAFVVGYDELLLLATEDVEIGECGVVGVVRVLCTEVVDAARELQGVGDVSDDLVDPCDATVFSGGKAKGCLVAYGLLDVCDKVVMCREIVGFVVVHPCGT